jgi:hypothetical protein
MCWRISWCFSFYQRSASRPAGGEFFYPLSLFAENSKSVARVDLPERYFTGDPLWPLHYFTTSLLLARLMSVPRMVVSNFVNSWRWRAHGGCFVLFVPGQRPGLGQNPPPPQRRQLKRKPSARLRLLSCGRPEHAGLASRAGFHPRHCRILVSNGWLDEENPG